MSKTRTKKKGSKKSNNLRELKVSKISKDVAKATNGPIKQDIYDIPELKGNHHQSWEDLNDIKKNLSDSIYQVSTSVSEVINRLQNSGIEIPTEVALATSTLYKDMVNIADIFTSIAATHDGKDHVVKDEDDLALLLETFNHYLALFEKFKALTFNELLVISEFVLTHPDKDIDDVDVVTDVEVLNDDK